MKYATWQAHGLSEDPEDLVQEALLRAMDGVRICPAETNVLVFLRGIVRSLANTARKRGGSVRFVPLVDESVAELSDSAGWAGEIEIRQAILALFGERTYGRLIVSLQLRGFRGSEIMDRTGLSRKELDTALRRIRRRLDRARKKGLL